MPNQTQCPNCGGYKLETKLTQIDPETGKEVGSGRPSGCLIVGVPVIVIVIAGVLGGEDAMNAISGIMVVVVMLAIPLFLIGGVWYRNRLKQAEKRAYNYYNFSCNLCGYQWQWREGTPLPKVKTQPDLIAAGNKRLEQTAAIKCKGCGNTIPEGYSYCPFCGTSR